MIEQHLPTGRGQFTVRKDTSTSRIMSAIERWSDENHAPLPLDYMWRSTPNTIQIIAALRGIDSQYLHVDLAHGQVIILLAPPAHAGQPIHEYYSEVPLPPNVRRDIAHVDFDGGFVIINLVRQKPTVFQRLKTEISHLRSDVALLFGKGQLLDDFTSLDM